MRNLDDVFMGLSNAPFRQRFKLDAGEQRYLAEKGLDLILIHARELVDQRLAPARPRNDGRQTPFRGHPVFVAQHATATCCRGCLAKWHGIASGRPLGVQERERVVEALGRWLRAQPPATAKPVATDTRSAGCGSSISPRTDRFGGRHPRRLDDQQGELRLD
jgi:hypothetical protein